MSGIYIAAAALLFGEAIRGYHAYTFKTTAEEIGYLFGASIQVALMIVAAILL